MAEILGIVTGLVGACDTAIKASRTLIKFVSDFANAPKDAAAIRLELENLEAIVSAVQGFLKSSKAKQHPPLISSPIARAVRQCASYVDNLAAQVAPNSQGVSKKAKWAWKTKDRCREILQELNRYTSIFHLALSFDGWDMFFKSSAETTKALKEIQADLQRVIDIIRPIEGMKNDIKEWEEHVRVIRDAVQFSSLVAATPDGNHESKRAEQSLDFITQIRLEPKHQDVLKIRHENTALWAVESTEFRNWVDQHSPFCLWVHGIPGCGKTVMFSAMVEHLKQIFVDDEVAIVAVYISHQDPTLHCVEAILQAVLRSTVRCLSRTSKVKRQIYQLEKLCRSQRERQPTMTECVGFLKDIVTQDEPFVLCLDGLDELPDKSQVQLLKIIETFGMVLGFRALIMSRSNLNLRALPHSEMLVSTSRSDLERFLSDAVDEIIEDIAVDGITSPTTDFRQKVVDRIIDRSNGMFLLASLSVRQLRSASSLREILEQLDDLPEEVDQQYSLYFDRVKSHPRSKLALLAIQWVKCSYRPLQLCELQEALAVRPGDHCLDATGMVSPDMIIQSASGLLVLDSDSKVVRFVHDSLRDYLDRNESKIFGAPHLHILEVLDTYLNFGVFHTAHFQFEPQTWINIEILKKEYQFLSYACHYWNHHLNAAGSTALPFGLHIAGRVSASPALLRITTHTRVGSAVSGLLPFHIALLWRNVALTAEIIRTTTSANFDIICQHNPSPLHLAAMLDEVPCARLVIQAGQRVDQRDHAGKTPVHTAASCGALSILQFMLESASQSKSLQGVVDVSDNQSKTPLHLSLIHGQTAAVKLLLRYKSNINAKTYSGQSPAHLAILYCPQAVEILIDTEADFTRISDDGRSALHCACSSGTIKPALQAALRGSNPNLRDRDGATPLQLLCNCETAELESATWLVQLGADTNLTNVEGWSPLHLALRNRHYPIAEYLLCKGARTDIETADGVPPGLIAVGLGNCPQKLLDRLLNNNVSVGFNSNESLLHRAVRRQKAEEVHGIIKCGGNVHIKDGKGETPLHVAVLLSRGDTRHSTFNVQRSNVVSMLLHKGADPHEKSNTGYTPIQIAVIKDSQSLLRQLLNSSPNLERSLLLPDGTSLLSFCAIHSLSCFAYFNRLAIAKETAVWPLLEIAEMFLHDLQDDNDDAKKPTERQCYLEILNTHRAALGLPASVKSAGADVGKQACGVDGLHRMSCLAFRTFCEKAIFLCGCVGPDGSLLALQPDCIAAFNAWQTKCSILLGVCDDSTLKRLKYSKTHNAKEIEGTFYTGCGQDAIDLMFSLKWPKKNTFEQSQGLTGHSSDLEHIWQDDIKLHDSDGESETTIQSYRHGSTGYAVPREARLESYLRRVSLVGTALSRKDISNYDKARSSIVNRSLRQMKSKLNTVVEN